MIIDCINRCETMCTFAAIGGFNGARTGFLESAPVTTSILCYTLSPSAASTAVIAHTLCCGFFEACRGAAAGYVVDNRQLNNHQSPSPHDVQHMD